MARSNVNAGRTRPAGSDLLTVEVLRTERLSPGFVRVTLGGEGAAALSPMGYDQWFRLFLPVDDGTGLERLPAKLDTLSYLRYLTISRTRRPVLRNYTVRAHRVTATGPEFDVDFVVHGSVEDGTSGPAATWAQQCRPGDPVALIDEGITFPTAAHDRVLLVADGSGLPAVAGILASLPAHTVGEAIVEIADEADRQELSGPARVTVRWIARGHGSHDVPGARALAAVTDGPLPETRFTGWAVGESALATGARRHWVKAGVPKEDITFCGYWKAAKRAATV
ncbi:siderophore-interacting protein [Cellulomonas fimi]|uniref:siderophore-interacting protein n=1 Tax=Cellulomonas sp. RIT-PI-Y TaxID=3035297 RepID=UPI0021D8458F